MEVWLVIQETLTGFGVACSVYSAFSSESAAKSHAEALSGSSFVHTFRVERYDIDCHTVALP